MTGLGLLRLQEGTRATSRDQAGRAAQAAKGMGPGGNRVQDGSAYCKATQTAAAVTGDGESVDKAEGRSLTLYLGWPSVPQEHRGICSNVTVVCAVF